MCYGVKINHHWFPAKWHTSTKIPRWWCSLTRVYFLTDSFCENWNLWKVLGKIWKTFVKINATGNYYNPHDYSVWPVWQAQKGEGGGSEKCKSSPSLPNPLPVSLPSYPPPLLTNTCYTGLYCTCTSEGNWQFDSKENFFRKAWVNFNWRTELFNKLCIKTGFANWNGNRRDFCHLKSINYYFKATLKSSHS